jgi:hypothetical protein
MLSNSTRNLRQKDKGGSLHKRPLLRQRRLSFVIPHVWCNQSSTPTRPNRSGCFYRCCFYSYLRPRSRLKNVVKSKRKRGFRSPMHNVSHIIISSDHYANSWHRLTIGMLDVGCPLAKRFREPCSPVRHRCRAMGPSREKPLPITIAAIRPRRENRRIGPCVFSFPLSYTYSLLAES